MVKKCATCEANIEEEFGKLQGTIIKVITKRYRRNFRKLSRYGKEVN